MTDLNFATQTTNAIATLADSLRRSTVQVLNRRSGGGSGVIWNSDGVIITNAHVVRGSSTQVELWDGRTLAAIVTARDSVRDLVALQVEAADLPAATIGNSDCLRVGELVLAMGSPFGMVGSLTTGIIHAMTIAPSSSRSLWVQADVPLAPGNSGGPLANAQGQVIGIHTMIVDGRAFAVPSQVVTQFLNQQSDRPYLGITMQPVLLGRRRDRRLGLLILEVASGSPAETAQLLPGDILVQADQQPFSHPEDLTAILSGLELGDRLQLDLIRAGQPLTREVEVQRQPSDVEAA